MWKQQTPKPEAQFPDFVPPLSPHSSAVLQIPTVSAVSVVVHSLLGKVTTEKRENAPKNDF